MLLSSSLLFARPPYLGLKSNALLVLGLGGGHRGGTPARVAGGPLPFRVVVRGA